MHVIPLGNPGDVAGQPNVTLQDPVSTELCETRHPSLMTRRGFRVALVRRLE